MQFNWEKTKRSKKNRKGCRRPTCSKLSGNKSDVFRKIQGFFHDKSKLFFRKSVKSVVSLESLLQLSNSEIRCTGTKLFSFVNPMHIQYCNKVTYWCHIPEYSNTAPRKTLWDLKFVFSTRFSGSYLPFYTLIIIFCPIHQPIRQPIRQFRRHFQVHLPFRPQHRHQHQCQH